MLWCAMCRMVYVYATLSSLALSSQPVCAWIGWHRCLTVCTYAHIVQTIVSHLLSLLLLLLYILYNIYTTTIHIPNIIFVYIILCHVKRLCYIPTLVYTPLYYTTCMGMLYPLWYMTMDYNLIHYINILYYYYYNNHNSYLFLFFIFIIVLLYVRMCMRVCCAVLSLVSVCSLVCPRICSYMCICVCLPRITLPDRAVVKRLMCWYRGVYFGKKFLQNLENGYAT